MSINVPTLLPPRRWGHVQRDSTAQRESTGGWRPRAGVALLVAMVTISLVVVIVAADRPTFLVPPATQHYFPHWLAGPLGGLLPGLSRSTLALDYIFTYGVVGMYLAYVAMLGLVRHIRARWVIVAVLAVHVVLFLAPPLALTDVFNYLNYGRMEIVHGLNPYASIPILEPHDDPAFAMSNWHHLLSPYGPTFTILTFAIVPLGVAASLWVMKAILMVASLGTLFLVWRCARLLGRDPVRAVAFVGLNPVVLMWGLGGDHNDFITIFLIMLAVYLLLRSRASSASAPVTPMAVTVTHDGQQANGQPVPASPARARALETLLSPELGAGMALMLAVSMKASAAVLIPVVVMGLAWSRRRVAHLVLGMAVAAVVAGIASYVAFGAHIPDLSTQDKLITAESLPNLLGLALGQGGETVTLHAIIQGALLVSVAAAAWWAWRRRELVTPAAWATVALLATLSWVLPWYVLWLLPLAVLAGSRSLQRLALGFGVYLILVWAPLAGSWYAAIGFAPTKTSLGQAHQRETKLLLH